MGIFIFDQWFGFMNAGVDFLVYFSQFLGQKQLNPDLIRKHILDSEYFVICIDENFSVLPPLTLGPEGFAVRDCPVCYRMFSINPGLYPQGAAAAPAVQPPPQCSNQKYLWASSVVPSQQNYPLMPERAHCYRHKEVSWRTFIGTCISRSSN